MITTHCFLHWMFLVFFQFLASSESIRWFVPKCFKKLDQIFKTILLDVKIIGIKEKKTCQWTLLTTLSSPNGNFAIVVIPQRVFCFCAKWSCFRSRFFNEKCCHCDVLQTNNSSISDNVFIPGGIVPGCVHERARGFFRPF